MKRRHLIALAGGWPLAALAQTDGARAGTPYLLRADVQAYLDEAVAAYGLDRAWVERTIALARYSEVAERLTTPGQAPAWTRDWRQYRSRNVDERRIREGIAFWRTHRAAFTRMEDSFGVPAQIAVAIIGVETFYGRTLGNQRTLDVLMTLAFDYTRRAPLYRDELAQFLLLAREQNLDPLAQRGSFAGALGLPQFMPGSIRRFAVDFDGDGRIDLARNATDAIGSVGHFLLRHGWQRDQPIQFAAQADRSVAAVLGRGILAATRWADVAALGVSVTGQLAADTPVLLLDLATTTPDGAEATEFRLGTVNMSALLHYNRSYFYACSVADLAFAIEERARLG